MGERVAIVPSGDADEGRVGELLAAHSAGRGVAFREYRYHVERDGRFVAGIVAWSMCGDLHIDMLAVDESARREGLGGALLAHVERLARTDGCVTASVDTFPHQAPDYYPAHGYEVVFRYPLPDGGERTYFSKRL